MREGEKSVLQSGVPFKPFRPRFATAILVAILIVWPWFILHPSSFDQPSGYHGRGAWIDFIIRDSSPIGRTAICSVIELAVFYSLWSTYLPCLRRKYLVILENAHVHGFGLWGEDAQVAPREISSVSYQNGYAVIRGNTKTIWIPLSLLDLDSEDKEAIKAALTHMAQ